MAKRERNEEGDFFSTFLELTSRNKTIAFLGEGRRVARNQKIKKNDKLECRLIYGFEQKNKNRRFAALLLATLARGRDVNARRTVSWPVYSSIIKSNNDLINWVQSLISLDTLRINTDVQSATHTITNTTKKNVKFI